MPKVQISKKKHNRKNLSRKKQTHRSTMSQSQNVYVYTHKPRSQRAPVRVNKGTHTTISPPVIVPFMVPLPPEHPFNINRPQNQSGISAIVPINNATTTTPAINPTTPVAPQAPLTTPQTLFSIPRGKRGKKLKYSDNPESGNSLPSIAEEIDNLDGLEIETLKAMAAKEKVNAHIPSKMKKPKLVNLLRKHHAETLKNSTKM